MKRFASIILLLLASATLCAQESVDIVVPSQPSDQANIVLVAPNSARVGELVRLDVTGSTAASYKWLVVPPSQDFEVYDSGRKAVFSARMPGEYVFVIAAACGDTVDVIRHVIIVRGPPPMPTSDALNEWIPFWAYTYNLPSAEASLLAASFEEVAARDDLETPEEWIKATSESNRAALGDKLAIWKPILDKIGEVLLKKAQDGSLMTPEQHKALWLEIASGLRKI